MLNRSQFGLFLIGLSLNISLGISLADAVNSIELANNLTIDAGESKSTQKPIVIFTTASDCEYCELLRENIFQFLPNDPRFILREVVMDSDATLVGFNNRHLSHRSFAKSHLVSFSPTVLFLSEEGSTIADPLVGVLTLDYYRYYFDKNVSIATKKLRENLINKN